ASSAHSRPDRSSRRWSSAAFWAFFCWSRSAVFLLATETSSVGSVGGPMAWAPRYGDYPIGPGLLPQIRVCRRSRPGPGPYGLLPRALVERRPQELLVAAQVGGGLPVVEAHTLAHEQFLL